MAFGLVIGTERALALQNVIQDELTKRGFSSEPDPVMAEYITIMMINNKTPAQLTAELEDLIGAEYDASFTDWLFVEAAKGAADADLPAQAPTPAQSADPVSSADAASTPANDTLRRVPPAARSGVYQQAITQAIPSTATTGHKRSASARSPSPSHPNKSRRTDLPTGPRAMQRDGSTNGPSHSRSLADRIGGPAHRSNHRQDEIQARIDNIVSNSNGVPDGSNMMMGGGFGGGMGMPGAMGGGMDMGMANPMMLQEMMMNQMALMAQMASSMGMMNPNPQFGMPMQGMPGGEMGMFPGGNMGGFQGPQPNGHTGGGRERGRGGWGGGRGRGGHLSSVEPHIPETNGATITEVPIVAPTPTPATVASSAAVPPQPQRIPYALPERPQTPSLCKFGLKCTNAHCRYSHPSPVATPESGVVLSNEACENGKDCKDKDCIKAHVSPAVLNPNAAEQPPPTPQPIVAPPVVRHPPAASNTVPCRFGASCTRPNCSFSHPPRHSAVQCRFGSGCTRAACPYQHPDGRVLPTSFHRGLSTNAPMVSVPNPEPGSMGAPSPHKSVKFNSAASVKERLKEIEEKKLQAEKAVKDAEAAANASKKDDPKPAAIAAA
ncbi:hypothetical protein PC9H_007963 [Pleurotus ostreatus]|uniref:Nab2 type CCCH zinc finger 4 domain-containing protein n=1 Tax=Pleurotus ostreatus TaxID=5322 RepID=A0A8H7DS15_PLEOS|nr:uncharacterized protein PC9H_007963 [Pleurotus ostreatus]KAF7428732.1 hypothetical protein PC9H_007963 [Pleurotus ostreatus]